MKSNFKKVVIFLILLNIIVTILAVFIGSEFINPFKMGADPVYHDIIFKFRMPRIFGAIFAGMTLAAGGLMVQITMNNQLADTNILGFQSGSTLVALLIMLAYPELYDFLPFFAFIGGMLVYLLVFYIASKTKVSMYLIVSGIAISSVIHSLISLVSMLFSENLENTLSWTNGSLSTISIKDAELMVIYGVVLLAIVLLISKKLDILLMEDDFLLNLGIKPVKLRFIISALAILLTSVSVSFVGTIGFVGLLGPHIGRRLVGNNSQQLMIVSILLGSLLVVGCDTLQRLVFPIYEIPVGTILSFVGGIYLIYLLVRSADVRI